MYQEMTIIGNVGRMGDVKLVGEQNIPVINFSVAVNERRDDKETTTWFEVSAWNGLTNVIEQYVFEGQLVLVKGRVRAEAWLDENSQPRAGLKLTANTFRMLSSRQEATAQTVAGMPF